MQNNYDPSNETFVELYSLSRDVTNYIHFMHAVNLQQACVASTM